MVRFGDLVDVSDDFAIPSVEVVPAAFADTLNEGANNEAERELSERVALLCALEQAQELAADGEVRLRSVESVDELGGSAGVNDNEADKFGA